MNKAWRILLLGSLLAGLAACRMAPVALETRTVSASAEVVEPAPRADWLVTASALQEDIYPAAQACDGRMDTRWSGPAADPQWLQIDMGRAATVCGMTLRWENAFASEYEIQFSLDGKDWTTVYETRTGDGQTDEIFFGSRNARYVKITGKKRGTGWGYSIWEVEIRGPAECVQIEAPGDGVENMADGCLGNAWVSPASLPVSIQLDLRREKSFGGVRIDWGANYAVDLDLLASNDGVKWEKAAELREGTGGFDVLSYPSSKGRFVRLDLLKAFRDGPVEIRELSLRGADEAMTPLAMYQLAAEKARPGLYPDSLRKQQVYWTLVGLPEDRQESLLDEYGNLEALPGGCSLMPYLFVDDRLMSAMDSSNRTQSLDERFLPLPVVSWGVTGLQVEVRALVRGAIDQSMTFARYRVYNASDRIRMGRLFLAVRPVQVNPAWQFGGLSPIRELSFEETSEEGAIQVNREVAFVLLTPPSRFGVRPFDRGDVVRDLERGVLPPSSQMQQEDGLLSGAAEYPFELKPGESLTVVAAAPLHGTTAGVYSFLKEGPLDPMVPAMAFEKRLNDLRWFWREQLGSVVFQVPDSNVVDSVRAQIPYILLNRDGPAIQPGSRNYQRSWIRDGSITMAALLRMGVVKPALEYLEWYAARVQPNGLVPPILNNDGSINTGFGSNLEYDSQGQFVYAMMEYYRFTRDRAFLERHYPQIKLALEFLVKLRESTLVPGYMAEAPARERFIGILPKSISHEGYDPPMHSYWDDFWALKGWKDGKAAAEILGDVQTARWAEDHYLVLRQSLRVSIAATMAFKQIRYIPGCAEKGDMDATSTAIAFFPCDEQSALPAAALQSTFDLYYEDLIKRLRPGWAGAFTPYEIRSISAFVGLGRKDYADVLLDFMLDYRRPAGWQHWAEVCLSDPRMGSYIGDMPHTWVGAGWVNAVRGMVVDEQGGRLVLLDGAPERWLSSGSGIELKNLPTHFGPLTLSARYQANTLIVELQGSLDAPDGLEIRWPNSLAPAKVTVDDAEWTDFNDISCRLPVTARRVAAVWP
ncbi:MAG TPA: hypothetical protein DCZ95_05280 [Verrucomicrobia bacterium]|nr:MAG: hypothetical protein A2X46_10420 [Lentisphaerae bacterium GWF2_57_35]HBA83490.1 hypothetical protein [Verrucomicrobiota bacterium]